VTQVLENRGLQQSLLSHFLMDVSQIRSAFTLPNPIFHLSVANGFMATGGPEGCIQVYQIDSSLLGQKGKGLSHANEIPLGETSLVIKLSLLTCTLLKL
jgi:hypothetical protein